MKLFIACWLAAMALLAVGLSRANYLQMSSGAGGGPAACAGSAWDTGTTNRNSAVALSSTNCLNDTATQNGVVNSWRALRGTQPYALGTAVAKVFTLTVKTAGSAGGWIGGVDAGSPLTSFIGSGAHAFGLQAGASGGNSDYQDGTTTTGLYCAPVVNLVQGNTLWLAFNFSTGDGKLWCSKDCVTWVGNGAANPASDAGWAYILSAGTYFPAWSGLSPSGVFDAVVINTTPNLGGCSNITGFSAWG
jgi:hypothetical protein